MKAKLQITGLVVGEFKLDDITIETEMSTDELLAYANMCVGIIQKAFAEIQSPQSEEPSAKYHVYAGKYDGDDENCKYCNSFHSLFEAEAVYDKLDGYPWRRIEHNGDVCCSN